MIFSKQSIDDTFTYPYSLRSRDLLSKTKHGIVDVYDVYGYVSVMNMDTIDINYHAVICFEI